MDYIAAFFFAYLISMNKRYYLPSVTNKISPHWAWIMNNLICKAFLILLNGALHRSLVCVKCKANWFDVGHKRWVLDHRLWQCKIVCLVRNSHSSMYGNWCKVCFTLDVGFLNKEDALADCSLPNLAFDAQISVIYFLKNYSLHG